jgi:hypothetical protein
MTRDVSLLCHASVLSMSIKGHTLMLMVSAILAASPGSLPS